ncbi:hypothetical protein [Billgrantia bachuensis]|uniref:Uncharacterized protein n=1 Tax=Billgrantia bachuensis TaxID=2717286 RepID=A0ABX0PPJ9_9GAMM|nr:hypothetical protein [Halomonas bachuensis]NIC05224.1 hypothetical protein [Halomonas bachuensis]
MTPRTALNRSVLILLVAFLLVAMTWVTRMDEHVASASLEQYCEDAAIWAAEEARGVPLNERAGQPDWENKAAEQCPGMRPALPAYQVASPSVFPATQPQRQLVQF